MAHITDVNDEQPVSPGNSVNDSRDAFIGCTVPQYIKTALIRDAINAPGGRRNVSWVINEILAKHYNKEQSSDDSKTTS